jgi:hypothetical protein
MKNGHNPSRSFFFDFFFFKKKKIEKRGFRNFAKSFCRVKNLTIFWKTNFWNNGQKFMKICSFCYSRRISTGTPPRIFTNLNSFRDNFFFFWHFSIFLGFFTILTRQIIFSNCKPQKVSAMRLWSFENSWFFCQNKPPCLGSILRFWWWKIDFLIFFKKMAKKMTKILKIKSNIISTILKKICVSNLISVQTFVNFQSMSLKSLF